MNYKKVKKILGEAKGYHPFIYKALKQMTISEFVNTFKELERK